MTELVISYSIIAIIVFVSAVSEFRKAKTSFNVWMLIAMFFAAFLWLPTALFAIVVFTKLKIRGFG